MTAHRMTSEAADVSLLERTRLRRRLACAAAALASAMLLGGSVQALAQTPGPQADHVWGGCELSPATVTALAADAAVEAEGTAEISFVVVYTLSNDNNGQPLGEAGFTGPVICVNPAEAGITAFEAGEGPRLTETSDIPTETDPGGAATVDILEAEESFIVKYQLNGGANGGDIEKRVCHTVDGNVDCFIIFPAEGPLID
jgi:hypothetical protein